MFFTWRFWLTLSMFSSKRKPLSLAFATSYDAISIDCLYRFEGSAAPAIGETGVREIIDSNLFRFYDICSIMGTTRGIFQDVVHKGLLVLAVLEVSRLVVLSQHDKLLE